MITNVIAIMMLKYQAYANYFQIISSSPNIIPIKIFTLKAIDVTAVLTNSNHCSYVVEPKIDLQIGLHLESKYSILGQHTPSSDSAVRTRAKNQY